jgi:hypothetical protein
VLLLFKTNSFVLPFIPEVSAFSEAAYMENPGVLSKFKELSTM